MARRFAIPFLVATVGLVACKPAEDQQADVFASALIGPDGGQVAGGSVVLDIPAGALTAETEIELRRAEGVDFTVPGVLQVGGVITMLPEGLQLRQPASLTFDGIGGERPAVVFEQDGLRVLANGSTAYLNELSRAIPARIEEGVSPRVSFVEPALGPTPDDAGMTFRDTARVQLEVSETPSLSLVLTIYDTQAAYDRPLNGSGDGECGFRLLNVVGGSLAADCTEGLFTAQIRPSSDVVAFDVEPFLSGKMETPVTVGVIAGSDELAYQAGFFSFETGSCFGETCSGVGTCVVQGESGVCECLDGFAAEGLECVCAPQCEGRSCGPDGCGGNCAPGCDDGESCTDEGSCTPDEPPPPPATDDGSTTDMPGSTGMGSTGMGSTGMGTTGMGTTGGSSG
ncbi:MAG: hypothetical protein K0V04_36085 [Deltaproteobacteria bacterium]|nr:hypothetical protein [Deltaproteobacteria bacterium]